MTSRQRPLVLAHRGACRRARENTLEAFAIARELGADGVELDVRRTRDGLLVLHHDPEIEGVGVLAGTDSSDLRAEAPWVPTLAAALDELRGLMVNVEVKCLPDEPDHDADRSVMRAVVALLAEHDALATAVVSSFELAAVDAARSVEPRLVTGFLLTGLDPSVDDGARLTAARGHEWFHPMWPMLEAAGTAAVVGSLHDAGVRTNVWTLDDPEVAQRLAAAGVDGVISNEPEVILAAFS